MADGDKAVGVFRGEINRFYQHWQGGRSVQCPGRDTCQLCASEDENVRRATGRFRVNFLTSDDGGKTFQAFIFEGGKRVYDQLKAINEDAPLEKMKVKISKIGKGKDTQTSIQPLAGAAGLIDEATEKKLREVKLHSLVAAETEEDDAESADGDVPF
jgi:hypothetical protein